VLVSSFATQQDVDLVSMLAFQNCRNFQGQQTWAAGDPDFTVSESLAIVNMGSL